MEVTLVYVWLKFKGAAVTMIKWKWVVSMIDRRTSEEFGILVGLEHITTVIRSGRLRQYGHVMRKNYDCVK